MVKIENKTETFWCKDNWLVDVVTTSTDYEAFIYTKDCGVKSMMFGMPIAQQSYDDFLEIVEANVEEYAELYTDEYLTE